VKFIRLHVSFILKSNGENYIEICWFLTKLQTKICWLFYGPRCSFLFFLFVYEIYPEHLKGFAPNSQGKRVWSLARTSLNIEVKGQRSRSNEFFQTYDHKYTASFLWITVYISRRVRLTRNVISIYSKGYETSAKGGDYTRTVWWLKRKRVWNAYVIFERYVRTVRVFCMRSDGGFGSRCDL